jgi:hypothetical protein
MHASFQIELWDFFYLVQGRFSLVEMKTFKKLVKHFSTNNGRLLLLLRKLLITIAK